MKRTPQTTPTYLLHRFEEAADQTDGCILCFLERRQVTRYLTGVAADGVNNIPLRQKLAARGGYCAPHSAEFAAVASPLSAAILLEAFVRARLLHVSNGKRPVTLRCEACEVATQARASHLKSIRRNRASDALQTALLKGHLCLDHFESVSRYLPTEVRAAGVSGHDDLLHDLSELIRKHDYRFQDESVTEAEKRSIEKALNLLGFVPTPLDK